MPQNVIPEDTTHFVARCRNCGQTFYTKKAANEGVSQTIDNMQCTCGARDFGVLEQRGREPAQNNRPAPSEQA